MAFLVDLIMARDNLATELATNSTNPKPNYSVGGRSIPWSAYRGELIAQIEALNKQIAIARGGIEIQTIAYG